MKEIWKKIAFLWDQDLEKGEHYPPTDNTNVYIKYVDIMKGEKLSSIYVPNMELAFI